MATRNNARKPTGREPKSNGQHLFIPTPPLLTRRAVHQTGTAAGHGRLTLEYHFAITRPR